MFKVIKIAFQTFMAFFVTFILNIAVNTWQQNDGTAYWGDILEIENTSYLPLDIVNYSKDTNMKLIIQIPKQIELNKIKSNLPINIEKIQLNNGNAKYNRISVSNLAPKSKTSLIIPLPEQSDISDYSFINLEEANVELFDFAPTISPEIRALKSSWYYSLICALFFGLYFLGVLISTEAGHRKIKNEVEYTEKRLSEARNNITELKTEMNKFRKIAIMQDARMSDYTKELDFWRDTLRQILYSSGKDKKTVEKIIEMIPKSLKTYSTLRSPNCDFETIKMMSKYVSELKD